MDENPDVTLPLATLVKELLGPHIIHYADGKHCISVSMDTACEIFKACGNTHTCHVQFPADRFNVDMFGKPIETPLVWDIGAWRTSTERHKRAKLRAKAEKEELDMHRANVRIVQRAILRISGLEPDQALMMAHRWVSDKNTKRIEAVGVTRLVTRIEEL